ncbi:acylneuraminate cytidylyltransferase family protein [Bradyrhizobium sp. CNPSo 4010]|uniref:Acylneuraminate cytidylyltransferase family protein n=1 Tax=Bradyrhizobium agreste TaxID=2751811 RepID=A0ABS0PVL6_9BRAD|nr:acylneuraminate cytidylyltransferase family protein [Bradyrhizobium agreste]MBH5401193.1 acylneuraminate cytidylyltransferase family protein [Bradyrhizobium agreste]
MARKTLAVIAARGGSKGIPHKNLLDLCGKPLIAWTVEQARAARGVDVVAVSSDSDAILAAAEVAGAIGVRRPDDISGDLASSESAWLHALDATEAQMGRFERVVALQATSPIREPSDIENALATFDRDHLDSLLSVCEVEDYFNWRIGASGPEPINYDHRNRRMRQQIEKRYLENGSFYVLIPSLLREQNNRLGGKIGFHVMDRHKMFQIDRPEDVKLCAAIMRSYGYA